MAWQVVIYILETPLPPTSELQYCEQLISPLGLSLLFQQSLPLPRPPDFAVSIPGQRHLLDYMLLRARHDCWLYI